MSFDWNPNSAELWTIQHAESPQRLAGPVLSRHLRRLATSMIPIPQAKPRFSVIQICLWTSKLFRTSLTPQTQSVSFHEVLANSPSPQNFEPSDRANKTTTTFRATMWIGSTTVNIEVCLPEMEAENCCQLGQNPCGESTFSKCSTISSE